MLTPARRYRRRKNRCFDHPESGARLLANIPRLEDVADMIRRQQTADGTGASGDAERGACMSGSLLSWTAEWFGRSLSRSHWSNYGPSRDTCRETCWTRYAITCRKELHLRSNDYTSTNCAHP